MLQKRTSLALITLCALLLSVACEESSSGPDSSLPADATSPGPMLEAGQEPVSDASAESLDAALDGAVQNDGGIAPSADGGRLPLTIRVQQGLLQGKSEYEVAQFLNVPYAAPPVGPLRFARPQPPVSWPGTRDATKHGPACIQPLEGAGTTALSEDCLTLDVYAPLAVSAAPRPVMVYLHGGGFVAGTGATFDSTWLVKAGDVLVVSLNYRLGALGFLTHPALDKSGEPSGNLGLHDQQAALRWVRDNIAAFGGDPQRVTLFGQSAGSMSTCLHAFARGSEGLVQRFIMQSGMCIAGWGAPRSRKNLVERSQSLIDKLCPHASDVLACLRAQPASSFPLPSFVDETGYGWWPYVDGQLIPERPLELLGQQAFRAGELIMGGNLNEYAISYGKDAVGGTVVDHLTILTLLSALYPAEAPTLWARYWSLDEHEAALGNARLTREINGCQFEALTSAAAKRGQPAYVYSFELLPAVHSMELDYVFGWPLNGVSKEIRTAPYPSVLELVQAVQAAWTHFAHTGTPNQNERVQWPLYQPAHQLLVLGSQLQAREQALDCSYWHQLWERERSALVP